MDYKAILDEVKSWDSFTWQRILGAGFIMAFLFHLFQGNFNL